jgi:hypothetical protein
MICFQLFSTNKFSNKTFKGKIKLLINESSLYIYMQLNLFFVDIFDKFSIIVSL